VISRVWLDRRGDDESMAGKMGLCKYWFTHSIFPDVTLRLAVWRPKAALCQWFYLDIALFDHILVDFKLLKI
jgi:hypothetical protein